jgi:hypothetical protein
MFVFADFDEFYVLLRGDVCVVVVVGCVDYGISGCEGF